MIAIFAIVIDLVHGLKSVEPDMLDLGRSLRGSTLKVLVKIRFPHALPALFSGMKVAISLALIGAIVGEFVAAKRGLGYLIMLSQGQYDTPTMFAAIVILALLGIALFFLIDTIERLALPWHASRRREGTVPVTP
jgi:NitT/TauT family transport system permease protein